jgi:hypothetical protein
MEEDSMIVLGIDPGAEQSGWVLWDGKRVIDKSIDDNPYILQQMQQGGYDRLAIECIRGYGQVVGNDTLIAAEWVGRFDRDCTALLLPRKEIKRHLCGNTTSRDSDIRQALIDRIGPQGSKKTPGPTFGIASHMWAALAVCVTAWDRLG